MAVKKLLLEDPPSAQSSSSNSDSKPESDSEPESSPSSGGFAVKPIAQTPKRKPQDDDEETKSEEEKEKEKEKENNKKSKKPRLSSPPPPTSVGSTTRLWSDEDEIAILTGLSDYRSEKGSDPQSDPIAFHAYVAPKLSLVEATKVQLYEKIRRLKKKYFDIADTGLAASAKPHEVMRFELSKRVWGLGGATKTQTQTPSQRKVKKGKKEVDRVGFSAEFPRICEAVRLLSCPNVSEALSRVIDHSTALIPSSKAKVLEKKWKKLEIEELELRVERAELASQAHRLILDAIKSQQQD